MRLSGKTVIERAVGGSRSTPSDFDLPEVIATIRDKGLVCIHEKAYLCPCKGETNGDAQNVCKNCGGSGYLFANPTKTKMIVKGISFDSKYSDWGFEALGMVSITALNDDKLSYMDRIVILDATAEYDQLLYPKLNDAGTQLFAYTKYDIKSIDYLALFEDGSHKLKRLVETTDYTFRDNVLLFNSSYNSLSNPCVTIRYVHRPTYHIWNISRESFTSYKFPQNQGQQKLILPVNAIGKRAHLIADVENFDGDRLFDNSWLPSACEAEDITQFKRQLQYTDIDDIYDQLTDTQKAELAILIADDDTILGANQGVLQIAP